MKKKSTAMALAVSATLLFPLNAFAQSATGTGTTGVAGTTGTPAAGTAGAGSSAVNGIPPGPGRPGGVNNSGSDPSGIGNAAKVPPPATSTTSSK
jgi:hypothetical protein